MSKSFYRQHSYVELYHKLRSVCVNEKKILSVHTYGTLNEYDDMIRMLLPQIMQMLSL